MVLEILLSTLKGSISLNKTQRSLLCHIYSLLTAQDMAIISLFAHGGPFNPFS
uniref:Uncharacterized protein n=1 Tax=Anguilla anguilla TaxID=7936 RepID=A0A0E9RMH4_ANGAN